MRKREALGSSYQQSRSRIQALRAVWYSQGDNGERLNRVLQLAAASKDGRAEDAAAAAVVLGRKDERREPKVREHHLEGQQPSVVALAEVEGHEDERCGQRDDGLV